jgi:PAB1-binding protein PBP1
MQPSEIEEMYYYEYWYYVQNLQEYIKTKNKQNEDQQEQANEQQNTMSSKYKAPTMPKIPSMKAPSMKMPKY